MKFASQPSAFARLFRSTTAWLVPLGLLASSLPAQSVVFSIAGVTTQNVIDNGALATNVPVGRPWSATFAWNPSSAPLFSSSTQAQYRLESLLFTFDGVTEDWSTGAVSSASAPSFTLNTGAGDEIQFTSGWGPSAHTNTSIYDYQPYSINVVLGDPTGAAFSSLTPAPSTLSLSNWSTNLADSYLKFYLNNDGNRYILGNITSITSDGSTGGTGNTGSGGNTGGSGNNSSSGTVTVGSGTLVVTSAASLGTGATVSANGTIDLQNVTATVDVTLAGGTLAASTGTSTMSGNIHVSATSTVNVGGTQLNFSGSVSGDFGLTKTGAGSFTLSGQNTFTGTTTVNAGTLVLQNSSAGSAQIVAGGTLAGVGTVRGNLANAGVVAPGFSPGTITVNGDYSQSSTGRLRMELASATDYDRLIVGGTATLGGALEVVPLPGFTYKVGQSYEIITANSVVGTFATVESPFAGLPLGIKFAPLYSPKAVTLAFQQLPFAPHAATAAQAAVAGALDSELAAGRLPNLQSMFNTYTAVADVRTGLNELAPLDATHWFEAALSQADAMSRAVREPHAGAAGKGMHAWAEVFQRDASLATQAGEGSARVEGNGVIAGVNWSGPGEWSVGAVLAYEDADTAGRGHTGLRSFQPIVSARRAAGDWRTDVTLGHAWHDYEASRPVALPGFATGIATGESSGRHWFASVRQSYVAGIENWTLTPAVELQHFRWSADGFTETGAGDASLVVRDQDGRSLAGKASVRLAVATQLDRLKLEPFLEAGWRHEFKQDTRALGAQLGGSAFTLNSVAPASAGGWIAVGVGATVTDRLNLALRYYRESHTSVHSSDDWQARLSYAF